MSLFKKLKQILTPKEKLKIEGGLESVNNQDSNMKGQIALLTPRENDLFTLLLEGFTLKESAKQLGIKYSTANTHITSIYKKLKVNSRAELIINYRMASKLN